MLFNELERSWRMPIIDLDNLFNRLSKNTSFGDCWIWNGATHGNGYGWIHSGIKGQPISAHRASWLIHFGDIQDDLHILHKCDNPSCWNPDHLFLGTHDDNMKDAA